MFFFSHDWKIHGTLYPHDERDTDQYPPPFQADLGLQVLKICERDFPAYIGISEKKKKTGPTSIPHSGSIIL